MVFISASNELGAFESGVAAALLGAVTAVVAGGVATIALAAVWTRFFPALAADRPARGPAARRADCGRRVTHSARNGRCGNRVPELGMDLEQGVGWDPY